VPTVDRRQGEQRRRFLELLGAWAIAVTQPVLAAFGEAPEHLLLRRVDRLELVALAVCVVVVVPTLAWLAQAGCSALNPRAGLVVHLTLLSSMLALFVARAVRALADGSTIVAIAAASVGTVAVCAALARWHRLRAWPRLLAITAPVFLLMFLLGSDASSLLDDAALPAGAAESNGRSIVFVAFDELPLDTLLASDGRIDGDLFPSFARLAATSTWYRNATTVHDRTTHAIPALLTGRRPSVGSAATSQDHPENLFTLTRTTHAVNAWEHFPLCPVDVRARSHGAEAPTGLATLLRDAFTLAVTPLAGDGDGVFEERLLGPLIREHESSRFRAFVRSLDDHEQPAVHFLHTFLPHNPWSLLPSGQAYDDRRGRPERTDRRRERGRPARPRSTDRVVRAAAVDAARERERRPVLRGRGRRPRSALTPCDTDAEPALFK
jgi:hypothetical protein